MSRQRRNFSAKFKSDLVIELLKGEKDLNTLATENNIQPNLLRHTVIDAPNQAWSVDITYIPSISDCCNRLGQPLHCWLGSR